MADVRLTNIKKIYPHGADSTKKKKKDKTLSQEEKVNLQITAEGVVAVQDFNLDIDDKEFIVLVGPSGCGKSTTLRMVAGLEEITEGELYIDGIKMNDVAAKDRDIAMVFQSYALYPHMTVYENMAFALKMRKTSKKVIDAKVLEAAEILGITDLLRRKPKALSGGQRQRVAIGRAIVREPKVFLMDEPLSNLDAKLRNQMRAELIRLRESVNTTFIYVTHDQTEAMTLGDRIVVMKDGFVQQIGTPKEVFHHPANLFVAGFIGTPQMNFFTAELQNEGDRYTVVMNDYKIELSEATCQRLKENGIESQTITLGIRPEQIRLVPSGGIEAITNMSEMMGSETYIHAEVSGQDVVIRVATTELPDTVQNKAPLYFDFPGDLTHLFDPETGRNLI